MKPIHVTTLREAHETAVTLSLFDKEDTYYVEECKGGYYIDPHTHSPLKTGEILRVYSNGELIWLAENTGVRDNLPNWYSWWGSFED